MAIQALYSAATGMTALQTKLDVIANNLANTETTAFKGGRANFENLLYRQEKLPGAEAASGQYTPTGIAVGLGSRVSSTQTDFSQGTFQQTNRQLDVAIQGNGFFQVTDPSGQIYYTRAGNFSVNSNGAMVVGSATMGRLLDPNITIPVDATAVVISDTGKVSVQQPNNTQLNNVGQIQLATFVNPEGLLQLGGNLYAQTEASGTPQQNTPGTNGVGTLVQSSLEASNVEPVTQLIDLITTQRSFELNSQAVNASDQIMQLIANLRRQ
jgi:flagellar basal-body rod protein FlgG